MKTWKDKNVVLVGVLKNERDLKILLKENWYRIPAARAPVRKFRYIAFYQPSIFGREGKRIQYWAKVIKKQKQKRTILLPDERNHPMAREEYLKIRLGKIKKLSPAIRNTTPRRISFGFASLELLLKSKNILELFEVEPIEEMVGEYMGRIGIQAIPQYYISIGGRRYCLDFAVFCKRGFIAIECDNNKAHSGKRQRKKDKEKDRFLRKNGWMIFRLKEPDVLKDIKKSMKKIENAVKRFGGPTAHLKAQINQFALQAHPTVC